jgi:hypothetical protein
VPFAFFFGEATIKVEKKPKKKFRSTERPSGGVGEERGVDESIDRSPVSRLGWRKAIQKKRTP